MPLQSLLSALLGSMAVAIFPASAQTSQAVEQQPISAAAKTLVTLSLAGVIVTAERMGEKEEIAVAGRPEPVGVAPERLLFEIGSITKVFTSLLLAQAVVEGKVTLDSTVGEILGREVVFKDPRVGAITLRQLSTHTSGLPRLPADLAVGANDQDPYAHYDRDRLTAGLTKLTLAGEGPFASAYSNYGAGLLGDLLARVYGQPWEKLLAQKITVPLGMSDTAVALSAEQQARLAPPYRGTEPNAAWHLNALVGAGGLHSTARDLLRFGQAFLEPAQTPLAAAFHLLREPQTKTGEIGLSVMIAQLDGRRVYEHGGGTGGYRSAWQVTPETRTVRVVLINNSQLEGERVLAAARREKPRVTDSGRALSDLELAAYAGVYQLSAGARFTILQRGGELWARLTGQPFHQLFPHELADRFFLKVVAAELQFHRTGDRLTSLTLHQNGRASLATRTDAPPPTLLLPTAKELAEYAGVYEGLPGTTFTLKVQGQTLYAQLTGQNFLPVFQTKADRFEYDVVTAALEFERDAQGRIIRLKLHQNGAIVPAMKKP